MSTVTSGSAGPPPAEQPAGFRRQRLYSLLNYTRYTDPAALFLWVLSTVFGYPIFAPIRYLVAGYFVGMLILLARQTGPAVLRAWPLFIIPILCTVSSIWSIAPPEALRKGIALAMTGVVAIYVSSRLTGRQILIAYFAVQTLAALLSLATPHRDASGAWIGIFDQKNFFAIQMFVLYGAAIGIMLDRGQAGWLRLVALVIGGLAAFLILMAKSGTTTIMMAVVTALILGQALIWNPIGRIRHARLFLALIMTIIGLIGSLIVFGILQLDVKEEILTALGKDSTLTGRTYLWEIAKRLMAEHPLTGLGAESFWRAELGPANSIAEYFFYPKFMGFSFHNSYYENGVAYGYPGFYATIFLATWALFNATRTWLTSQTILNATFLVLAVAVVIRTNSEADLAGEFSGTSVILFIAATRREKREKPARLAEPGHAAIS
jgi:exopolysaccharide production protein ExoQ